MTATTRTFGLILIVLGLASYFLTDRVSVTALIPAFFGAVFVILALVAGNESARKHAMHAAVALGLLGFLGTLRVIPALARGEFNRPGRARAAGHDGVDGDLRGARREVVQGRAARASGAIVRIVGVQPRSK